MTTTVNVTLPYAHAGKIVRAFYRNADGIEMPQADIRLDAGWTGYVWTGSDIVLREVDDAAPTPPTP